MFCSNCGEENDDNAKFCKNCGTIIYSNAEYDEETSDNIDSIKKCPKCGAELDSDHIFCVNCGTNLNEYNNIDYSEPNENEVSEENLNKNTEKYDETGENIEIMPIIIGSLIIIISLFIFSALEVFYSVKLPIPYSNISFILGSCIAGYLTKNSIKYSLIYGAIITCIIYFFGIMLASEILPLKALLEALVPCLFGAFIGKIIRKNLK